MKIRKSSLALAILVTSVLASCKSPDAIGDAVSATKLQGIIETRDEKDKARDVYRNPHETLMFFEVEPGMRVLEVLPGQGWYSKILVPYLGSQGELSAVDYPLDIWPLFGSVSDERVEARKQSMLDWPKTLVEYGGDLPGEGTQFGNTPATWNERFDRVLMIRALHNLSRFEDQAQSLSDVLVEVYGVLKPGGKVGVVQHQAPESASDEWAAGQAGYLKKSTVISMFEKAGFKLASESSINNNILDNPVEGDSVWRLPPTLGGHEDDASMQKASAIGESDRMTLLFVKAGS